jgi:hypothetical protein
VHYCRDHGPRGDRQKTRLIWLIEQLGFEAFADLVAQVGLDHMHLRQCYESIKWLLTALGAIRSFARLPFAPQLRVMYFVLLQLRLVIISAALHFPLCESRPALATFKHQHYGCACNIY